MWGDFEKFVDRSEASFDDGADPEEVRFLGASKPRPLPAWGRVFLLSVSLPPSLWILLAKSMQLVISDW